jgi:hypothetical protein
MTLSTIGMQEELLAELRKRMEQLESSGAALAAEADLEQGRATQGMPAEHAATETAQKAVSTDAEQVNLGFPRASKCHFYNPLETHAQ